MVRKKGKLVAAEEFIGPDRETTPTNSTQRMKERRRKLYENERQSGFDSILNRERELSRIRTARRRKELYNKIYKGPDADESFPGETHGERRRRLGREYIKKKREEDANQIAQKQQQIQNDDDNVSDAENKRKDVILQGSDRKGKKRDVTEVDLYEDGQDDFPKKVKELVQIKIQKGIERSIQTATERKYYYSIFQPPSRTKKGSRQGRPKNYLELDAQIAEEWCFKDYLIQDLKFKFDSVKKEMCVEALEIEVGPEIPEKDKTTQEVDDESQNPTAAQNRWNDFLEHESGDEDNNAIVDSFNHIQIKIEQEDVDDNTDDNEERVEDWIARVMADSDEDDEIIEDSSQNANRSSRATKRQNQAKEKLSMIKEQSSVQQTRQINLWKRKSIQRMQMDKLKKLKVQLKKLRDRWIAEKPEEDDARTKVDNERKILQEKIVAEKQELIDDARLELAKKREFFSKESLDERKLRIRLAYQNEISVFKLPTVVNKDRALSSVLTKEQQKAKNAENARKRIRKEKQEYDIYKALVAVMTSSEVTNKEEIESVEKILAQKENQGAIEFWYNYKASKTDQRVLAYRKLLYNLMSTRVRNTEEQSSIVEASAPQPNLTHVTESQSLKDITQLKEFLVKKGKAVDEHVTYKRFYINEKQKTRNAKINSTLTPQEIEKGRIEHNARYRKNYHKKKFGLETELGDYLKTRDPTRKNNKFDQSSQGEAPLASLQRKRAHETNKPPKKRKSKPQEVEQDSDSEESLKEVPDPTVSYSTYNNNEFSNSGDGFTDCGADDGSNEMWTPSGSLDVDSSLIATGTGEISPYYQQQFQSQGLLTGLQLHSQIGRNSTMAFGLQTEQYFNPQLHLVNSQLNVNQNQQHCWTGQQYLPNSQLNMLAHISSNQQQILKVPQEWYNNAPSSSTHSIPETSQKTPQKNFPSENEDNDSSSSSLLSPPKKSQGRHKIQSKLHSRKTQSQNSVWKAKKSILKTRPRRKIEEIQSPFVNITENLSSTLAQNINNLLPKCSQCDKIFDTDDALQRHITKYHPLQEGSTTEVDRPIEKLKCKCRGCPALLKNPYNLIRHLFRYHFKNRKHSCPFQKKCHVKKMERNSLAKHIYKKHPDEFLSSWVMGISSFKRTVNAKKCICRYCQDEFKSYKDVFDHYKTTHGKIRYCCIHCGIYLREEDFWEDHVKLLHPEKIHKEAPPPLDVDQRDMSRCKTCHSDFSSQSFLEKHISEGHTWVKGESVQKKGPCYCKTCDEKFPDIISRDDHLIVCRSKSLLCHFCKSKFDNDDMLKKHFADFHPQEPLVSDDYYDEKYTHEVYKCEICRRSYTTLYSVRWHAIHAHRLLEFLDKIKEKGFTMEQTSETPNSSKKDKGLELTSNPDKKGTLESESYTCPKCPFKASAEDFHFIHKSYDKVMKRYCAECDRVFSRSIVLIQHNEVAHGRLPDAWKQPSSIGKMGPIPRGVKPEDWHSCEVCSLGLTSEEVHACHLWSEKDSEVRNCPHCKKKYYLDQQYSKHLHEDHNIPVNSKMSTKKSQTEIARPESRELTPEDYDKLIAVSNVKTSTGEMEIFSCLSCLKNFKTHEFIRKHIQETHKEDAFTRVACKQCNLTFASNNNLRKHTKYHHPDILTKFQCQFCDILILRREHIITHLKVQHKGQVWTPNDIKIVPVSVENSSNEFACTVCSRIMKTREGLKSHLTNVHFPIHFSTFCDVCGLQINPKSLKIHQQTYHKTPGEPSSEITQPQNRKQLNLMEVAELVKEVYDEAGIDYQVKFRPKDSQKPKRGQKHEMTSNEDDYEQSDNEEFCVYSSSSSDEFSDIEEDDSDEELDQVSLKDILIKPQRTAEKKAQPRRKSVKTLGKSVYVDEEEEDYEKTQKLVRNPKAALKKKQLNRKLAKGSQKSMYVHNKSSGELQTNPLKKLVILLERCDSPKTITDTDVKTRKRKVPVSSYNKKLRPTKVQKFSAPNEESLLEEIAIKEELFDELEIEPETEPLTGFNDIESELDNVLQNYNL